MAGDDKVWRKIYGLARKLDGASVKVGVMEGDIAEIAMIHEYGAPKAKIPERSFIRSTFRNKRSELAALQARICALVLAGKLDEKKAMALIGAWSVGAIKATITKDGNLAPLAASTIAAKGSSRPLVDTSQLVNSITFVVIP